MGGGGCGGYDIIIWFIWPYKLYGLYGYINCYVGVMWSPLGGGNSQPVDTHMQAAVTWSAY